jgi:hypothetical protein
MIALRGNTYDHKDAIKKKGGRWDAGEKCWFVPQTEFQELKKLCENKSIRIVNRSAQFECDDCGDYVCSGTSCWETGLSH